MLDPSKRTETERGRWQEEEEKRREEGKDGFDKTWSLSLSLSSGITLHTQTRVSPEGDPQFKKLTLLR